MIEDPRNRVSRGEPDSGAAPTGPPGYSGWPSAGHAPDSDGPPTDVYAALSDLAPRGAVPAPPPDHGLPVPRDFVPPQITWTPAPEPIDVPRSYEPEHFDGSRVPRPREPVRYEGSQVPWSPVPELPPSHAFRAPAAEPDPWMSGPGTDTGRMPTAPIERFEQRREDWHLGDRPATHQAPAVEWAPAAETEVFDGPMIDLSASRPLPVTHRGRRRRARTVVAVAALGAVLAGGTGYAVLRGLGLGPTTRTDASVPYVTATPPVNLSAPAVAPADPLTVPPSAGEQRSTSASPAKTTPATTAASPTGTSTGRVKPDPTLTVAPTKTASPLAAQPNPAATSAGPAGPLTANLRSEQDNTGYVATVTLTNPGGAAVTGWTVRVTVTGATQVTVVGGGVSVARSGDTVVFTPASGATPVAGGGTLTFAFAVAGSAGSTPSGCQVNGTPCF